MCPQDLCQACPDSPRRLRSPVSRRIEAATGWSIRKFVKTARRYRAIEIQAGDHVITAADPLPGDLRDALTKISNAPPGTHLTVVLALRG
jgi:hypothetical protein